MGYDVTIGATKERLIAELTPRYRHHEVVGDILWGVMFEEILNKTVIVCNVLADFEEGWGYKEIFEFQHPSYYSCPLRFLALAPRACLPWREKVRGFHSPTQNITIEFKYRELDWQPVFDLQDTLNELLESSDLGTYLGSEMGLDDEDDLPAVYLMEGPNAHRLWEFIKPQVEAAPFLNGARAILTWGAGQERVIRIGTPS